MIFEFASKTHPGYKRESSEDRLKVFSRAELYNKLDALLVVADGMGGVLGGGTAAQAAVDAFQEYRYEMLEESPEMRSGNLEKVLTRFFLKANTGVQQSRFTTAEEKSGNTTCVAALVRGGRLVIGSAGDSRAYRLRGSTLELLTNDHSDIWREVRSGRMTPEEARVSKFRNSLTRYLGRSSVLPEIFTTTIEEGDTLLLCSDGLTVEVDDRTIGQILATAPTPQAACDHLLQQALDNGGSDNITVVLLRAGSFHPANPETVEAAYPRLTIPEEDTTDPNQNWRASLPSQETALPVSPVVTSPSRFVTSTVEEEERAPSQGFRYLSIALIVIFALIALGEGYLLYQALHRTPAPPPAVGTLVSPTGKPGEPVDIPVQYRKARLLVTTPLLRDAPLLREFDDSLLAASRDGKLVRIDTSGKVKELSPVGPTTALTSKKGKAEKLPSRTIYFAMDTSHNRYQTNPEKRTIEKYNSEDVRVASDIGEGQLTAPASLTVDSNGTIYLIDAGHLKVLEAVPTRSKP